MEICRQLTLFLVSGEHLWYTVPGSQATWVSNKHGGPHLVMCANANETGQTLHV